MKSVGNCLLLALGTYGQLACKGIRHALAIWGSTGYRVLLLPCSLALQRVRSRRLWQHCAGVIATPVDRTPICRHPVLGGEEGGRSPARQHEDHDGEVADGDVVVLRLYFKS